MTQANEFTQSIYLIGWMGTPGSKRAKVYHAARRRLGGLLPGVRLDGWPTR
jgi:hypothetical protein